MSSSPRNPRWGKWRLMPEVKVWEAVSLSLGIEPTTVKTERYAWMGAEHPFDEGAEFNDRLSVLLANSSNRNFFPTPCRLSMSHAYQCGVRLNEFASWALTVAEWDIPDDLKQIAASTPVTVSKATSESATNKEEDLEEAEFVGAFAESVRNGRQIDWRYWLSMKTWNALQASRLMFGLDPDIFEDIQSNGPTKNDTARVRENAKKVERLANNLDMDAATPLKWLDWAKEQKFKLHGLFQLEIEREMQTIETSSKVEAGVVENQSADDWKEHARHIADECFDHDTNAKPSVRDSLKGYSSRVMEELQKRDIKGPRGIITNPNTVMREALVGEKWWRNKKK